MYLELNVVARDMDHAKELLSVQAERFYGKGKYGFNHIKATPLGNDYTFEATAYQYEPPPVRPERQAEAWDPFDTGFGPY